MKPSTPKRKYKARAKPAKVQMTIRVDPHVLGFFKLISETTEKGYQTLIGEVLNVFVERHIPSRK